MPRRVLHAARLAHPRLLHLQLLLLQWRLLLLLQLPWRHYACVGYARWRLLLLLLLPWLVLQLFLLRLALCQLSLHGRNRRLQFLIHLPSHTKRARG